MNRILKSIGILLFTITLIFPIISCSDSKTFRGRVIDADTKEPIAGAVVVVEWKTERTTPTATHTNLKDVKEIVTDENGEWSISGPKGRADELIPGLSLFIPYTKEPIFTIFYPGYCPWPKGFEIKACKERIKPGGNGKIIEGETIELPKLRNREDRLEAQGIGSSFLTETMVDKERAKKIRNFLNLLNEEKKRLGLDEYPIWKELENEK
jgi:hypothetical protein